MFHVVRVVSGVAKGFIASMYPSILSQRLLCHYFRAEAYAIQVDGPLGIARQWKGFTWVLKGLFFNTSSARETLDAQLLNEQKYEFWVDEHWAEVFRIGFQLGLVKLSAEA